MAEDRIRILVCKTCESIDPLPFYDGPPEYDTTLEARVREHQFSNGDPHIAAGLFTVPEAEWNNREYQRQIIEKISEATLGGETGLGSKYYDVKSTFQEDAMTCWRQHNKTSNCDEYKSDRKKLVPDTRGDRKELGLDPKAGPVTYLCQFCPMESIVMQKRNRKWFK